MDLEKSTKLKTQGSIESAKSGNVESFIESSLDEKSDDDIYNIDSKLKLLNKRKGLGSSKNSNESSTNRPDDKESENSVAGIDSTKSLKETPKELSIAQSIKKKFGLFRRSENVKLTDDVEFAVDKDIAEIKDRQTVHVIADVHCENEKEKPRIIRKDVSSKFFADDQNSDKEGNDSLPSNKIDRSFEQNEQIFDPEKERVQIDEFKDESDSELGDEIVIHKNLDHELDRSVDELTSEISPTSGSKSLHSRRRWEKAEISAENVAEDLKKKRRRQWAKGSASADICKSSNKNTFKNKRSSTAEPKTSSKRSSSRTRKSNAKNIPNDVEQINYQGYENEGFSSDHDEVLRIETINNSSPKIQIGIVNNSEKIKYGNFALSEEDESATSNRSNIHKRKDALWERKTDTSNFSKRKVRSRRRSSSTRKGLSDKKPLDLYEDEVEIDEEEEQKTVLSAMDKKLRRSSSSSKIDVVPFNYEKELSDETTISTNEEMQNSHLGMSQRSHSRSKSKIHHREKIDNHDDIKNSSERSSREKLKVSSSSNRNSTEEYSTNRKRSVSRTKKRPKKKERKKIEDHEEQIKYVSVTIHRCDMLETDYITRHPMVKVHLVKTDNGEYLRTHNKEEDESEQLQAMSTREFDFKENKSMVPVWEQELIFKQDFKNLLIEGTNSVLILFEIVDLLKFAKISNDQLDREASLYKIAWAFLKPVGCNGVRHVDKKIRLQLYKPKKMFKKTNKQKCEIYRWWKSGSRDKYSSSLYVSVTGVDPPILEPVLYEQLLQNNDMLDTGNESQAVLTTSADRKTLEPPKWTRLAAQTCQIPNETYLQTEASDNGCFYLAFSNTGKYLACALSEEYNFPILVYKIDEGKIHVQFSGHKNFIYSLSWSQDDRYLLSASSDQTARLWDVQEKIIEPVQSLPHPSYVYCGKFAMEYLDCIVTGCYDHVARIWTRIHSQSSQQYELVQELEAHESFVSAVCLQSKNKMCLTGDGLGVIIVWSIKKTRRSTIRREWQIVRKIKIREIEGIPINTILMHPFGSRILVHSRNHGLRLMDLDSGIIIKKFEGLKNQRIQITSCISPCGTLLFCGGEDSSLNVWGLETGKLLAMYEISCSEKAVTCVDYHPYDHILAFAVYGAPMPVQILKFDREADGKRVGLKHLDMTASIMSTNSIKKLKDLSVIATNGGQHLNKLSAISLNSSVNVSQIGSDHYILAEHKDYEEAHRHFKGKLNKFLESGSNLKVKSMNRLNGIIEKIDRILMYATNEKSPPLDSESAQHLSVFTVEEKRPRERTEVFEMNELPLVKHKNISEKRLKKHRQRSRSARNACSPTTKQVETCKAFSDSAALNRTASKTSDDSSYSNRSIIHEKLIVERLELEKIEHRDTEFGFNDSVDTILGERDGFPSDEILDIESLKSDDTYVVDEVKKSTSSDGSNATFVIESEIPIPKPRTRIGGIVVK